MKKILAAILSLAACPLFAADLTVPATAVVGSENAKYVDMTAGAVVNAGQLVYKDTSDSNKVKLANATNATKSVVLGIAASSASTNQPIRVITEDSSLKIGAGTSTGLVLIASNTDGGITASTNVASGFYPVVVGVTLSSTNCSFKIVRGSVAVP